jgi:hypothetical protein
MMLEKLGIRAKSLRKKKQLRPYLVNRSSAGIPPLGRHEFAQGLILSICVAGM